VLDADDRQLQFARAIGLAGDQVEDQQQEDGPGRRRGDPGCRIFSGT